MLFALTAHAQLAVTVLPMKIIGQKAIVPLAVTNNFTVQVESARAICFLLDENGKMIGQSAKWVIGGTKVSLPLQPRDGTAFDFVLTIPQPWTSTNLTAKVSFSRVVLDGDKLADLKKDVNIVAP